MPIIRAIVVSAFVASLVACGGGSSSTAPSSTSTSTSATTVKMYSSSSPLGPWTSQSVTVAGHDALGLVDPSPVLMPDGSILLYYLMSYQTTGDPAASQPGNLWKIGVAQSTDRGLSFTHKGIAYTGSTSTTDPFPLMLDASGNIRLLISPGGPGVFSVTATDTTGLHFATSRDAGQRTTSGGPAGALKIGSTYFLYSGANYFTSSDGLNFSVGGPTGIAFDSPSPIDAGGGTYLIAYICGGGTNAAAHVTCMASSTDGRTWTNVGQVGAGSVPGLVKDSSGTLRIYVPNQ